MPLSNGLASWASLVAPARDVESVADVAHLLRVQASDVVTELRLAYREQVREGDARNLLQAILRTNGHFGRRAPQGRRDRCHRGGVQHSQKRRTAENQDGAPAVG